MNSNRNTRKQEIDISVIIPAYKAEKNISACLKSLLKQQCKCSFEIIIVNSFQDKTPDIVKKYFPETRLINSPVRLLPGAARNKGIQAAKGKYIAFLAADCTIKPDWISLRILNHSKGFLCVGGVVFPEKKSNPITLSEYLLEYSNFLNFKTQRVITHGIPHNLSYKKSIFSRYGFFREDLRAGEDTLFNKILRESGIQCFVDSRIVMYHKGSIYFYSFIQHQYLHGRELIKFLSYDKNNKWNGFSFTRRIFSIAAILPFKKMLSIYKNTFISQPKLLMFSILLLPLLFLGHLSLSLGAVKQIIRTKL